MMPEDNATYTFVLDYAGGTHISQYKGRTPREAFGRWIRTEPAKLERLLRRKLAVRLVRAYAEWNEFVELDGVENVWCWTATLPGGLALLNFVRTARKGP